MLCPNCGKEVAEGTAFCTQCGTALGAGASANNSQQANPQGNFQNNYQQNPYQSAPQYFDPKDHSAEFDPRDVSNNKVIAMLPYLLNVVGVLIAIIAAKDSPYVAFHVRESLKFTVCESLLGIIALVLCFTIIVPIAAGVCIIILLVCRIIAFVRICSGKAIEAPIIGSFGFLK